MKSKADNFFNLFIRRGGIVFFRNFLTTLNRIGDRHHLYVHSDLYRFNEKISCDTEKVSPRD